MMLQRCQNPAEKGKRWELLPGAEIPLQGSTGERSLQRGSVLQARISAQAVQALANPEVPAGPFLALKLAGLSALLDWACWGIKPLPPASWERLQTARILKDHWSITHSVNK